MTVFDQFISKAEQKLQRLFENEQEREDFLRFTLKYTAENEEEEVANFAWALMKLVVPDLLPRETVLRIHMTDPRASDDLFVEIVPGRSWRPTLNHIIYNGLHNLVGERLKLDLRPLLSLPNELAEATQKLDGKASLARQGNKRQRLLNEFSRKARNELLEILEDPAARARLETHLNLGATSYGKTRRQRLVDYLVDKVLPNPIPRATALQLLLSDDEVCKEEVDEHGWMQMAAELSMGQAIQQATEPVVRRFRAMYGSVDRASSRSP